LNLKLVVVLILFKYCQRLDKVWFGKQAHHLLLRSTFSQQFLDRAIQMRNVVKLSNLCTLICWSIAGLYLNRLYLSHNDHECLFLQHIRKYGSAFLNCDGGVLIAGILDNGNWTSSKKY
jgi:hypothetical protein